MLASQRIGRFFAAAALVCVSTCATDAQPLLTMPGASNPPIEPLPPAEPVAGKRAENAELLRVAQRRLEAGGPSDTAAAQAVAHYQSVEAVLAQQEAVEQQIQDLTTRKAELENQLKSAAAGSGENAAACSFVELDRLKDDLATEQARASLVDDKLTAAKAALEKAQRALDESEIKRRQAQEAFDTGQNAPNAAELAAAADGARQAATLAAETVALRKREVAREQLAQQVQRLAVQSCQEQVARVSPLVVFSAADYEEQIAQITKKEEIANRSLLRAQASLHSVEVQLREAQQEHDAETGDRTVLAEKLEAQRRTREKLSDDIDSTTQRLQRYAQLRVAWNRRFKTASADRSTTDKQAWDELKDWQRETREILEDSDAGLRMQILRMRDLRSSLTSITKKADAKDGPEGLLSWVEMQRSQVEAMLRIHEKNLITIETSRRVHEKLLEELGRGVLALTPKTIALGAWHQAEQIWYQEITTTSDGRSIWVGKVVTCLIVFSGGWTLARIFSAVFANRILKRFRLSKDATAAVRTLVFYSLLAVATLFALKTVNVPLTAFTVLGGALAIGVGFGSQALVNNFIGGLIMLAERPVRLGERIIFGNFDGVVEDVGFRCTKLRTANDHLITIPNSTLVNDSIENAARRRTIRRLLNLTISCDTPRERVAAAVQAVRDILAEKDIRERIHPIVGFEEFPPRVFFNEFKPDSFNIQIVYWYAPPDNWEYMDHSERVNLRIMEEFERLGVAFAFPTRTLYLANDPKRSLAA